MRVLIVKMSSLGDVIHTLPALTDSLAAYPELRFDWVVEEAFSEVPGWHPAVERFLPIALRRWRKQPFMTLFFFGFHIGAVLVPLFLLAHNLFLKDKIGISLFTLNPVIADAKVRGTPMRLVNKAYWVAVNFLLVMLAIKATKAAVPMPLLKFSNAITPDRAGML